MTHPEFNQWVRKLGTFFPGFVAWLDTMRGRQKSDRMGEWWAIVRRAELKDAISATRQLWKDGGCPYGEIPPAVLRIIRDNRPVSYDFPKNDDDPKRWQDMTEEDRATARGVIADVLKELGPRDVELPADRPRAVTPSGKWAMGSRACETVEDLREYAKTTAMPMRIETMGQWCERQKRAKQPRGRR